MVLSVSRGPSAVRATKAHAPRALKKMRFGTHFSGMESWGLALQTMNVKHEHVFACDSHEPCRNLLKGVFKPKKIYEDVAACSGNSTEAVDLLCTSPPCQPFSSAGKGNGCEDFFLNN